jgi:hypothetical protein
MGVDPFLTAGVTSARLDSTVVARWAATVHHALREHSLRSRCSLAWGRQLEFRRCAFARQVASFVLDREGRLGSDRATFVRVR